MEINFIPIDYDYFDFNGRNYAKIIGRSDKGKRICIIDNCDIYFWAILHEDVSEKKIGKIREKIEKIVVEKESRISRVLRTEVHEKNYLGRKVKAIKIFVTNFKDSHAIADEIDFKEIDKRREYDLGFVTKYILERKLKPLVWHEIDGEVLDNSEFGGIASSLDVDLCLKAEKIIELEKQLEFKPRILAYDVETDDFEIGKGQIVMISLVGEGFKKVLSWKRDSKKNFVEVFKNEEEMLRGFVNYVKKYSPDILVGYFSDGFDLPYLRARAEENRFKLSLGLDDSQPVFSRGAMLSAKIRGIVHIDLLKFIRIAYSQYLQSETLSLNDVASELLGEKKLNFEFKHSSKLNHDEWENYFEYNLQDSVLTYKLAEKAWPDLMEFSKVMQEPLYDVSRDGMSSNVENYIIHNLSKFNEIIEKRPLADEIGERRMRERYEGAFVFQPKPGLYENICFFDFTSYWPSIIVTFNLSKSTFLSGKEKDTGQKSRLDFSPVSPSPRHKSEGLGDALEVEVSGKKFYFSKKAGFFPEMLKDIIEKRKQYKKEYAKNPNPFTKARSNAFKLLANASYGYQGFFGARYYCPEASAATTAISRDFTRKTIELINKRNYEVIYSDSVDGKTKVIVKEKEKIYETEIEKLFKKTDKNSSLGKEYDFKENIEVLTLDNKGNSAFMPIVYVMRHDCNKKMFRINFTNNWHIDVTEDHSLIGYQSEHFNKCKKIKKIY